MRFFRSSRQSCARISITRGAVRVGARSCFLGTGTGVASSSLPSKAPPRSNLGFGRTFWPSEIDTGARDMVALVSAVAQSVSPRHMKFVLSLAIALAALASLADARVYT